MRISYLSSVPERFLVHLGSRKAWLPSDAGTLYSLQDVAPEADLVREGVSLVLDRPALQTEAGLEFLRHVLYLNTEYYTYTRLSSKAPARDGMPKPTDHEHHVSSLLNLPLCDELNHVQALRGAAPGAACLMLQPGPSLDPDFVRSCSGQCLLLAIGRVVPRLLEQGIVPDLVYQQDTSRRAWEEAFGALGGRKIPAVLVANPAGHLHGYARQFKRVYKSWNYFDFETDRFPPLGCSTPSSTSGAFSLAVLLGCRTIISHGGDFGRLASEEELAFFEATNLPHEDHGEHLLFSPLPTLRSFMLRRPGLPPLLTSSDYVSAAQWLKKEAWSLNRVGAGLRLYDRSSTGVLCENSEFRPFGPGTLEGAARSLDPRAYVLRHPWRKYARDMLRRYESVIRVLRQEGRTSRLALEPGYNSMFSGMPGFDGQPMALEGAQLDLALARAEEAMAALVQALAGTR